MSNGLKLLIAFSAAASMVGIGLHYAIGYLISKVGPFFAFLVLGLIIFGGVKLLVSVMRSEYCQSKYEVMK